MGQSKYNKRANKAKKSSKNSSQKYTITALIVIGALVLGMLVFATLVSTGTVSCSDNSNVLYQVDDHGIYTLDENGEKIYIYENPSSTDLSGSDISGTDVVVSGTNA